ncbi:MAG: prefoldin subunit alpha [Candidatus Diapherotrites archaeon CG11_big_fil_rev_8_21_14_0_20_37_9]|nr:MAG: prefoldin subunit alpha [Candidatus Diapherotrites archaeon CG11_big_fil_rev_8_21_14_0_20_37_9]
MTDEKKATLTGPQLMQLLTQEERKLEDINSRINAFQNYKSELIGAKDTLKEIEKNKEGDKILVNIGAGVYLEAKIEDSSKAIAAIAGNVFNAKSGKELQKLIDNKLANMDKSLNAIGEEQQKTLSRINQLNSILEAGRRHMQQQARKN